MFASQFDGFSQSQASQSPDSSQSPAKGRETHGLIPVTVKQISEASQSGDGKSNFFINGVELTNVTLVGMLINKVERVTDVSFTIDDGTGQINCKRWVNETFDTKEMEEIVDGMYVRVNGHLKNFQSIKQLGAFSVRPVTNYDEITFHFIDCIHAHLLSAKVQQGDGSTQSQINESSLSTPVRNVSKEYQTVSSSLISGQSIADGLKGCDQLVLDFLQQPSNFALEKGVHIDEMSQKLKFPVEKIMESIRSLEEEGLIYSTVDEFHYKSTASC